MVGGVGRDQLAPPPRCSSSAPAKAGSDSLAVGKNSRALGSSDQWKLFK